MKPAATERFTERVSNYIRYRPDYPPRVLAYLVQQTGLNATAAVADIGAGTGIFTEHLLKAGYKTFAVEPNKAMREAASGLLQKYPNYIPVAGSAAATGLEDRSADLITCAQAFHWFNHGETKTEFQRVLRPDGYVALIWNRRATAADAFSEAYEALLQSLDSDYREVNHQRLTGSDFEVFFREGQYVRTVFLHEQLFTEAGLIGRAQSSSYVPAGNTPAGKLFNSRLSAVFRQHQQDGLVKFHYDTEVYLGRV